MEEKTITFISGRKTYTLPIESIHFIMMKKQDAFVHLSDGSVLKTRMSLAEFSEVLEMILSGYIEAVLFRQRLSTA